MSEQALSIADAFENKKQATKDSLAHWKQNLNIFPLTCTQIIMRDWWDENCKSDKCPLCEVFIDDLLVCVGCPLNDKAGKCCSEWEYSHSAARTGALNVMHIELMCKRIEKEYKALCATNALEEMELNKIIEVDVTKCMYYINKVEDDNACPKKNGQQACDVFVVEGCNRGVIVHYDGEKHVADTTGCTKDGCGCGSLSSKPLCVDRCPYGAIKFKGKAPSDLGFGAGR